MDIELDQGWTGMWAVDFPVQIDQKAVGTAPARGDRKQDSALEELGAGE